MMTSTPDSALEQEIANARRSISSDGYPMSIGELTNLYREGELVIRPEFQRYFRWSDIQKSRLVESLLLKIPIPSIFVAQTEGGRWELVDGLQRVATILELQGVLQDSDGTVMPPLQLCGTKYLPSLEGRIWSDESQSPSLSEAQRLDIKRSKLDVKIISRDSSPQAKFDLFQRLNSYGTELTAQEIRSALTVAISPECFDWLESMCNLPSYKATTMLSERMLEERFDLELVMRFLVLHRWPDQDIRPNKLRNLPQILDDAAVELATSYPDGADTLERVFQTTFDYIAEHGADNTLRRWDATSREFKGSFLSTAFEVFALGIGYHILAGNSPRPDLLDVVKSFWESDMMKGGGYATGLSTEQRLVKFIPIGRELMAPE